MPPGQETVFQFTITAPANAGTYNFQFRPIHNGTNFGQAMPNKVITVTSH